MKKILLAALAAFTLFGATAHAQGVLRSQQVRWRFPANVTTAPYLQQTKALAAGGTDTTEWVGTEGWLVPFQSGVTDTALVGRFIVYVDSIAAYAPGQTTLTAVIDVAAAPAGGIAITGGGYPQTNYHSISYTLTPLTGEKVMQIPIAITRLNAFSPLGASGWGSAGPFVRLRIATSAAINAASCKVQYMAPASGNFLN